MLSIVKQLSPTLASLVIRVASFGDHLLAETDSTSTSPEQESYHPSPTALNNGKWTIPTAFPHLEALELTGSKHFDLLRLPLTLTSLGTSFPADSESQESFIRALPQQLLHLTLVPEGVRAQIFPSNWRLLPCQLLTLDMNEVSFPNYTGTEVADLPRTLTRFKAQRYAISNDLTLLPPSLTKFNGLIRINYGSMEGIGTTLRSLKSLDIGFRFMHLFTRSLLRNLPATVTKLSLPMSFSVIEREDWPKSLTKLSVAMDSDDDFRSDLLPSGLRSLDVELVHISTSRLKGLPNTLTQLSCFIRDDQHDGIEFPPALTSLTLNAYLSRFWVDFGPINVLEPREREQEPSTDSIENTPLVPLDLDLSLHHQCLGGLKPIKCFPFDSLPKSLTSFVSTAIIPASQLKHLPRRLTTLTLNSIFTDASFNRQDRSEILAMQQIMNIGREEGICEQFDSSQLTSVTVSSLLPRTLQKLTACTSLAGTTDHDWAHFPPQITELDFSSYSTMLIGRGVFTYATKLDLRSLLIDIDHMCDDDFKALPRKLNYGTITNRQSALTKDCCICAPPNAFLFLSHSPPNGLQLPELLLRHRLDEDPTTYYKLLDALNNEQFCLDLLHTYNESLQK